MDPDCRGPGGVFILSLQDDPSPVRERFEDVLGGVLINAHHRLAALLEHGKRGIGPTLVVVALTSDESSRGENN